MKDPIKIIHKFKNNNRRIQYKVYIFIGPSVSPDIIKILEIIKNKDFYNSLINITNNQYKLLEDYYGDKWYQKFFTSHHLKAQFKIIETTPIKKKQIQTKFGSEWYTNNITMTIFKKISYSFSSLYYQTLLEKKKKLTKQNIIDFRTHDIIPIKNPLKNVLGGGYDDDDDDELVDISYEDDLLEESGESKKKDDQIELTEIDEENLDEIVNNDFDLNDFVNLYNKENVENDKIIKQTSKMILEATKDKKWEKNIDEIVLEYDDSLDSVNYNGNISEIYQKYYITDEYIFKDDTIKVMRQKICVSIPMNKNFNHDIKLLPEIQYFWSEYNSPEGKEQVMIGQKWVRRNELLKIDILPNENLSTYEKLRNNLIYLKESFGYKIKREDDETNIINYYDEYITFNEIYMLDLYNELGIAYNADAEGKRNLFDVYINIYFPMITFDRLENIINLLNGKNDNEIKLSEIEFLSIKNDTKLEKEIYIAVNNAIKNLPKFDHNFAENHIIQSNIHININNPKNITGTTSDTKYNLYRIFDNFILTEEYPFIQYQTNDSNITYKFYTKSKTLENNEILSKWFENAPYGISFKILIEGDKYISINLNENGRIEYKITWTEIEKATMKNIIESYDYIRNLLKKINNENKKIKFMMPDNDKFNFAFINTIQKFTIPDKFKINHNDLSEFSRFFFPYVSLVIEPKKRVSKKQDKQEITSSKYGTYLRYKRISKYENRTKIHLRILYFLRNYELNDKELVDEISKQFNITLEQTFKEIAFVKDHYGNVIKKSSKVIKKLSSLPKSKPPGIGIDIQGRDIDKYKIRITGARTKPQLDDIINFMKVLIYLYTQTYLYKKKEYEKLKLVLKSLSKIAKRRNKVMEIVNYETSNTAVKLITSLDKKRLGFKPEKGQSQWTRSCQNSGNDKKRRPEITNSNNTDKLIKNNYKFNDKTGYYEKNVTVTIKKKKYNITLKAVKLFGDENNFNFYTCDPSENNEFMHIGFLSKGNNPNDLCMPCCFKKDQLTSANKQKKNYYLKCIGEQSNNVQDTFISNITDKIYILQETNKIQDNRFIILSKYLDILFNKIWNHDYKIKNHYLQESKSGYFFKYTIKNDKHYFLGAISNIYEKNTSDIINLAIEFLIKDKKDIYFTFLNNGDIKSAFKTKENYIDYLKTSTYLEYDIIGELLMIPNVITQKGICYFIIEKNILIIKKTLEEDEIVEKYYLKCLNFENNWIINEDRDIIFLIKEGKYYFPIFRVQKNETVDKKIKLFKIFDSTNKDTVNIINELKNYYIQSCTNTFYTKIVSNYYLFCKNLLLELNKKKIIIQKQVIDDRNKCKYLYLDNNILLPVYPSGISYNLEFINLSKFNYELEKLENVLPKLKKINESINMNYIPKIVFYDKKENNKIHIISLLLENDLNMPIYFEWKEEKYIKSKGLSFKFQPQEEEIDKSIKEYDLNYYDNRNQRVKTHLFFNESYNIFRLELSLFLHKNEDIKEKIINIVKSTKIKLEDKKNELRKLLFKIISPKLSKELNQVSKKESITGGNNKGATDKFVNVVNEIKNIQTYNISNLREYCEYLNNKDKCQSNLHCSWHNNSCMMQIDENMAIDFVNKVLEEFIQMDIQYKELIQDGDYYVSDIVDYSQYTNRSNQKIIKTTNFNISKIMNELFGKDKTPIIGRRSLTRKSNEEIIENYPDIIELGNQITQPIIPNRDSIIRAFVNCYYWVNNSMYDKESRNLGYFSELQTLITNQFKAKIIDFILKIKTEHNKKFKMYLHKYCKDDEEIFNNSINYFRKNSFNTNGKLELYVLSLIFNDKRIVVYNNYNQIIELYLDGDVNVTPETIKNFTSKEFINKNIFIKMDFDVSNTIPKTISSIYYI